MLPLYVSENHEYIKYMLCVICSDSMYELILSSRGGDGGGGGDVGEQSQDVEMISSRNPVIFNKKLAQSSAVFVPSNKGKPKKDLFPTLTKGF